MSLAFTIFKSIKDNKTHKKMEFKDWEEFKAMIYLLSEQKLGGKQDANLISPAIYGVGETRKNINVIGWAGWAALDIDDYEGEDLINDIFNKCGKYKFICYSTASSKHDKPKFRLVFETTRQVSKEEIKGFWYALNTEIGSLGDLQVKDLSRMYYTPGNYAGAYNFIFSGTGDPIDPSDIISSHPIPIKERTGSSFFEKLPDSMQEMIVQHRKDIQENTNIRWRNYTDCPFVNKKMIAEYSAISQTGWYHKMYQLMVSIAALAVKKQYPISSHEIAQICREIDSATGSWYDERPLEIEADRAIEYVYRNNF